MVPHVGLVGRVIRQHRRADVALRGTALVGLHVIVDGAEGLSADRAFRLVGAERAVRLADVSHELHVIGE